MGPVLQGEYALLSRGSRGICWPDGSFAGPPRGEGPRAEELGRDVSAGVPESEPEFRMTA
jgi:hypothetical protein